MYKNINTKILITLLSFILLSFIGCNKNEDITGNNEINDLGNYAGVYKSQTYDINIGSDGSITVAENGGGTINGAVSSKEGNKYTIKLDNGSEIIIEFLDNGSVTITKSDGTTESATKQEDNNTGGETQSDGKDHKNHSLLTKNWISKNSFGTKSKFEYNGEFLDELSGRAIFTKTYQIKVEKIIWSSDTAGIMYGQYTEHNEDLGLETPKFKGKYYGVAFQDLSESTCSFSGALKVIDGVSDYKAETLEEAITKFIIENGYFNRFTDCKVNTEE